MASVSNDTLVVLIVTFALIAGVVAVIATVRVRRHRKKLLERAPFGPEFKE